MSKKSSENNKKLKTHLLARLKELRQRDRKSPTVNAVSELAFEISRDLEDDRLSSENIAALVEQLERGAFHRRAESLKRFCQPTEAKSNKESIKKLLRAEKKKSFKEFQKKWHKPLTSYIFTAHPTFMLGSESYRELADIAGAVKKESSISRAVSLSTKRTLEYEHEGALEALHNASEACDAMSSELIGFARKNYPKEWKGLKPNLFRFGTWVGYDMDGRDDISWSVSIRFRLLEKAIGLGNYIQMLQGAKCDKLKNIIARLEGAKKHSEEMAALFAKPLDDPQELSEIANKLTHPRTEKIVSLTKTIAEIEKIIPSIEDDIAEKLMLVTAAMRRNGLGVGRVHFRINAAQLHNAIRRKLGNEESVNLANRAAMVRLCEMLKGVKPVSVDFATLAMETTSAVRQFLVIRQILHHIDADTPIRMLIAECEQPATVLVALYFSRLFGIHEKVDISPLFETHIGIEQGHVLLEALCGQKEYVEYVKKRGVFSIQLGFSDAGRFLGQIPATLGIERLQGRLAKIMKERGLEDVDALIFNTHGESMGRGAHPASMKARMEYVMTPWARHQFEERNITLHREMSFQGGDGYVFFANRELALATLTRIMEIELGRKPYEHDPFYKHVDISLDFYNILRRYQADLFHAPEYSGVIHCFGTSLLPITGSRQIKRANIIQAKGGSLRRMRAIPHNAILQQLGYPVNVVAGLGSTLENAEEAFLELYQASERAQQLISLAAHAVSIASIRTIAAYGRVFDGVFWALRAESESKLEQSSILLAEHLSSDSRFGIFQDLVANLRVDGLKFQRILKHVDTKESHKGAGESRNELYLLHSLRLALMQHIFLLGAALPTFSKRNQLSRDEVIAMLLSLNISEAVHQLREAYPVNLIEREDFSMKEPCQYLESDASEFAHINEEYIDRIEESYEQILNISTAIAHYFRAFG